MIEMAHVCKLNIANYLRQWRLELELVPSLEPRSWIYFSVGHDVFQDLWISKTLAAWFILGSISPHEQLSECMCPFRYWSWKTCLDLYWIIIHRVSYYKKHEKRSSFPQLFHCSSLTAASLVAAQRKLLYMLSYICCKRRSKGRFNAPWTTTQAQTASTWTSQAA